MLFADLYALCFVERTLTPDGRILLVVHLGVWSAVLIPLLIFGVSRLLNHSSNSTSTTATSSYNFESNYYDAFSDDNIHTTTSQHRSVPWWWMIADLFRRRGRGGDTTTDDQEPIALLGVLYGATLLILGYYVRFVHFVISNGKDVIQIMGPSLMLLVHGVDGILYLGSLSGAIADDGNRVDSYGWYGQPGVLLYFTLFCCMVCGAIASTVAFQSAELLHNLRSVHCLYNRSPTLPG